MIGDQGSARKGQPTACSARHRHRLRLHPELTARTLLNARSGSINPCRLTPHIVDRGETVKQHLTNNKRFLIAIPPRPRPRPWSTPATTGLTNPRDWSNFSGSVARINAYPRQQRALGLPKFAFRCAPVCRCLAHARIHLHGLSQCIVDGKKLGCRWICRPNKGRNR